MGNISMGEKIKLLRAQHELTLEQVAQKVGVGKSTVRKWETGIIANMKRDKISALADALHTTPAYLMGWEDSPEQEGLQKNLNSKPCIVSTSKKKIPLLGNVACGEPIYADQSVEAFISVDENMEADFCLRAQGDSMINARIFDGDFLFVKKQAMVDDGDIALVIVEDEATVKRVYYDRENNVLQLIPENPKYKILRYVGAELDRIRILGKIVAGQYKI